MVAVHPYQKEWNPWMNGSCRVMTRCQNHIFSEMAILNVPWTELNRVKSCTLQVRGPLSLVFFESCFLQGCTVCSVSTCFVRQVQHFEDSQGFACDPEKLVASDSNWKNNKIRIPKYISNLGVFLGRKWPNRFAWSETRTLNSLSTVLKLKEPTTLVFFSFFIDSSHTWLKWRPRIAVFHTLPPCHPDGVVLHFQCMIFRTLTPHAPDHWCCASCTYCFCLGSLALLMDGFPWNVALVFLANRHLAGELEVNLPGTSKTTMPLSDKTRVFCHPCERLG